MLGANITTRMRIVKIAALSFAALESRYGATLDEALALVVEERLEQDQQWGGFGHDQEHDTEDWLRFIEKQVAVCRLEMHNVRR